MSLGKTTWTMEMWSDHGDKVDQKICGLCNVFEPPIHSFETPPTLQSSQSHIARWTRCCLLIFDTFPKVFQHLGRTRITGVLSPTST